MTSSAGHVDVPRRPSRRGRAPGRLAHLSRRTLYLGAAAGALLAAAALIGLSLAGGSSSKTNGPLVGAAGTSRLLAGIPQQGTTLGSPKAPYTLVEYADLQCPYCGVWARDVFPAVVKSFVRTGKLRIEFRGLTFVGPDSKTALETAIAAASQGRFWNVLDLLYRNQGVENGGWVTDSLVRRVLAAVPGLDVAKALDARDDSAVAKRVSSMARLASLEGIDATPTFEVGRPPRTLQRLAYASVDAASFTQSLGAAIGA